MLACLFSQACTRNVHAGVFELRSEGVFFVAFISGSNFQSLESSYLSAIDRLLGTSAGCLVGYMFLKLVGGAPGSLMLLNAFATFIFVFMRSSSSVNLRYIGGTAAWVLPIITLKAASHSDDVMSSDNHVATWDVMEQCFAGMLCVLFFELLVFGERAEKKLRHKIALSLELR
jgi:hypothetical protein